MSYTDRYKQGSFRGLKFFTSEAEIRAGQRRAVYEIPFDSGGAASVDLGRKPRKFSLTIFLLELPSAGEDLDVQVNAFLAALEQPGPGLLVHPYLGSLMVLPEEHISVNLSTADGGKASISFQCTESRARAAQAPLPQSSARASVPKATAALRVANRDAFVQRFNVHAIADFARDANANTLLVALQNLRKLNGIVSAVLAVPGELTSQVDAISLQVVSLLDTPDKLYDTVVAVIDSVYQSIGRVASRFGVDTLPTSSDVARVDAMSLTVRSLKLAIQSSNLTATSPPAGLRDTEQRARERQNRAAIDQAMQAAALAAIVDAANLLELPSRDDNTTVRDLLLAALDELLIQDLEAGVVDTLDDVRAGVWSRFTAATTVTLTTFTPGDDMPADVIAWQLYGDADRAAEICDRNSVADPGQVPGLIALEVLGQ